MYLVVFVEVLIHISLFCLSDEDMISLASSMSLTYAPSSAYGMMGSSRFGSDSPIPEAANGPTDDFTNITHQLQALERCPDLQEVDEENEKNEFPTGNKNETKGKWSFILCSYDCFSWQSIKD